MICCEKVVEKRSMPATAKKNSQKISEKREEKDVGRIKEAEKRAEVFFFFTVRSS